MSFLKKLDSNWELSSWIWNIRENSNFLQRAVYRVKEKETDKHGLYRVLLPWYSHGSIAVIFESI